MPDFSRDDRMPPISQSSLPSSSHATGQRERRFSGPSDSGAKSARYPGVYQRPSHADYYRSASPPPQPYRWPPPVPHDEPVHPSPHPGYRREPWDYRYRDGAAGPPPPPLPYPPARTPSPFPEWGRPWSPRRGPDESWSARRDWEERENGQIYVPPLGWDRPSSPPPPPPPRDWQTGPYDRAAIPSNPPRGSPPLIHESAWSRESVPHFDQYERDMREDWIRPDDYPDDHFIPEGPYANEPHPPSMPYGPRARGRSFVQERRVNPAPAGYSHPSASQASPRGPSHVPLDSANRRHPQHDRRFSGGPGYSGDGRPFVSNNSQRRQFQHGRGSFNDPNHLQSRGAKLVPRDQLLVANTSIKVEDNDGHPMTTPTPVFAASASPDKAPSTGKRARTDSVAAEAEPASRRPSPFASSNATAAEAAPVVQSQTQASATLPTQAKPLVTEPPANAPLEPDANIPPETLSGQEQRVYAEPNDVSEPANEVESSAPAPVQSDMPMEPAKETATGNASAVVDTGVQGATASETVPDMEPAASALSRPLADVNTNTSTLAADASAVDAETDAVQQEVIYADPQLPLLQFEYLELSDDDSDDNKENAPPFTLRDAIPLRRPDLNKLALDIETVLQANLTLAPPSIDLLPATESDHPVLDVFAMPPPTGQHELSELLCRDFAERETYVELKVDALEDEYLTLNDKWAQYCLKLDRIAEQRRVRDAAAATMAALNVVSEPVAAQTRSTRRNPIVNAGVMADAVHSDMEMEKVMNNMRDAAAVDPDLLARPNLARIPDMVTVMEPEMLRFTFVDENGQVDDPLEFYDFRGRAAEHWTTEERDIFIDQHRVFNKRFDKIAEHLPHKTTSQCVKYYYLMKKVPAFRAQVKRGQRRRLGRGGHQGKASALMADIEKEEDGTGRDDEFIATRRSRRHAAAASYATAAASTPPPASAAAEAPKPRRSRVVELARADSYETDRGVGTGTTTPMSFASDSDVDVEVPHPSDLDTLLSSQPQRKGGPGRGRRWGVQGGGRERERRVSAS